MMAKRMVARATEPASPGALCHEPAVVPTGQAPVLVRGAPEPLPGRAEAAPEPSAAATALALPGGVNVSFAVAFHRNQPGASFWDEFSGPLPWAGSEEREGAGHWETTIALEPGRYEYLGRLRGFLERTFAGAEVFEVTYDVGCRVESSARPAWPCGPGRHGAAALPLGRRDVPGPGHLAVRHEVPGRPPARPRRICAGLVGSWWAQVPADILQDFLGGFRRVFLHSPTVRFIENAYVDGEGMPRWAEERVDGPCRICKLDHGSIHEMLKDFPTESELRRAMNGLERSAPAEAPCYYWVLTFLPAAVGAVSCVANARSGLHAVLNQL